MATIKEIAALAGVSRGTVDRVLNDRGAVNPETAEKIRKIAKELMAIANTSAESHRIAAIKKQIKEYERKHNNLLNNVAECDIPSVCKSIFVKIEEIENIIKRLEESLETEMKNQVVLSDFIL